MSGRGMQNRQGVFALRPEDGIGPRWRRGSGWGDWTGYTRTLLLLLGLLGPMALARGAVHDLADVSRFSTMMRSEITVGHTAVDEGEDIVTFRLSRDQQVLLNVTRVGDGYRSQDISRLQAALWTADDRLISTFGGDPLRLVCRLRAGDYQVRVRHLPSGNAHGSYTVAIGPGNVPTPKVWGLIGLGVVAIALQMFHASRASTKQIGGFRLRDLS